MRSQFAKSFHQRTVTAQALLDGVRLADADMTYSRFINLLAKAGIEVDRKVLADLAIHEPEAFGAIVEKAKAALA